MRKGTPKFEYKDRKFRGKRIDGDWKEPWKSYNPNCASCMYGNDERTWASVGTCGYALITGRPRSRKYKAKDCPGFPGRRITRPCKEPEDMAGD